MYICPVCFSDIEEGDSCPICHYNLNCRESEESQADIISYRNNWVDEQLAKYPDLSEFEIEGTILKKYTGNNPVSYMIECRINKAKVLLVKTDHSIETIIFECGFSNRTAFFKKFLEMEKTTPLQFRKNQN
jgi:transcriptional regulator GlxA family with amidase domain